MNKSEISAELSKYVWFSRFFKINIEKNQPTTEVYIKFVDEVR